jgi:hypothetical protein
MSPKFLFCTPSKFLLRYSRRLQGSSSSWQLALATDTVGGSLGRYLCHVKAENLAYTLVRSILFVSPVRIDEVFDIIHGLEHSTNALKQQSKTVKQDHPILLYWQDKVAICDSCTVSIFEHWSYYNSVSLLSN